MTTNPKIHIGALCGTDRCDLKFTFENCWSVIVHLRPFTPGEDVKFISICISPLGLEALQLERGSKIITVSAGNLVRILAEVQSWSSADESSAFCVTQVHAVLK